MTAIGYARVSTIEQDLSIQEAALKASGRDVIRADKRSGTTTEGRAELRTVLDFLRQGDVLMVTRIDRLARSIGDLQAVVGPPKRAGASLEATKQPIDTSTGAGKSSWTCSGCSRSLKRTSGGSASLRPPASTRGASLR